MTLSTTDYNIFKKHESNRQLDEANLKKIRASIKCKNLLQLRPILVNKDMQVIDGQHRLHVAKELDLPIFYIINEDSQSNDIILLNNNQKNWRLEDYLNYYINEGREEYIKFKDFIDSKNIPTNIGLNLCGCTSGNSSASFKAGRFEMPHYQSELNEKIIYIKTVQEFLRKSMIRYHNFIYLPSFTKALIHVLNIENFEFGIFMKKIELNSTWIQRCSKINEYIDLFKKIYNYKNHSPIQ